MSNPADEITGVIHETGRNQEDRLWRVFTSYTFADGGQAIIADRGPFLTREGADVLRDLATDAGIEDIPPAMVTRARAIHLAAMNREGRP